MLFRTKLLGVFSVLLLAFTGTTQAASQTINFGPDGSSFFSHPNLDENSSQPWPEVVYVNPYDLALERNENNNFLFDVAEATSNQWLAYNFLSPSHFVSSSGELFNLDSFWLAGEASFSLFVKGYANGIEVSSTIINVNTTAQEYFFTDFQEIDTFSLGSVVNINWWALGSVTVTAVPEPETYAMLLAGLGVVGAITRRRTKKVAT